MILNHFRYGVQECLKTLVHASTCNLNYNTSKCKSNLPCNKMKRLIRHAKTCSFEYTMALCNSCKNYISLCVRHAKGCQENQCSVLLCEYKINFFHNASQDSDDICHFIHQFSG